MASLTTTGENRALEWLLAGTPTAPVGPLAVALVTALGTDTTAGTEVVGGSYARQTLSTSAVSGGAATNSADLSWTGMPAVTVVGVEIWDSAGTPIRWWHGPLDAPRDLTAGDELRIPGGDLTLAID
ncbi:hypothetical protein H3146_07370 [Streptomyces sp. OF3]|uniref:Uncharacterized protein n=1 Tax=Streptomyces alkaliterrae TaxID=2213162 RepID=A0A7W3WJ75_9ACTN|nr:hypothetical protein [Streptomyces alkaliterrae]MBB1253190.1 hypothetical protein [Streptomyces alkaliterrae]